MQSLDIDDEVYLPHKDTEVEQTSHATEGVHESKALEDAEPDQILSPTAA